MSRRLSLLALVLAAAPALLPAGAQDTAASDGERPVRCEIGGTVSALRMRVRTPSRRALTLDGVIAVLSPLRHGLTAVRATLEDGTAVEGTTRYDVPFEVGSAATISGGALVIREGAAIDDIVPVAGTASALVDVELADGVFARGVSCPCAALRPAAAAPAHPHARADRDPATPTWRPRVRDLHIRSGDAPDVGEDLHLEVTDAEIVLVERARHRGWVRLFVRLPGGDVSGWSRDTDLSPAPHAPPR